MHIVAYLAVLVFLALATLALVALAGRRHFQAVVTRDVVKLFSDPAPRIGPRELAARRESLPEPVRSYLRFAIPEGAPAIGTVRLMHGGFFRTDPNGRWFRMHGEQYFTVAHPGFVWNARIWPAPLLWIEARTASSLAGERCL